jgi:hypothetical protein
MDANSAPIWQNKFVHAPYLYTGAGTILHFEEGRRKLEAIPFKYHLRLTRNYLAVDGCVFAQFDDPDKVVCRLRIKTFDNDTEDMDVSSD